MLPWYDTMQEAMVIVPLTKAYHDDRANEYIAVAVDLPNRDEAFDLVDRLNDISVNAVAKLTGMWELKTKNMFT